jgi:hypothetical protein
VKFQLRKDEDGKVQIYLLDHEGWFISDDMTLQNPATATSKQDMEIDLPKMPPGTPFLKELMHGIENCVVLENQSCELQLMVANHDINRPTIKGEPFGSYLIFDRSSVGWQQVMDTRFFLYPVHTSRTFLLPETLSATLYLLLLRFFNRDTATLSNLLKLVTWILPLPQSNSGFLTNWNVQ